MHDFWWVCARQFLVTPDERPCCLVVDCGTCPCQVDHAWLQRRDEGLARHLAAADLVLAPSRSAARVLAANGVDEHRLRVDENGLPEGLAARAPAARPVGAPLRLLFTGGRDPLKGLPVLRRALGRIADLPGWELVARGVTAGDLERPGLPVRALPAFAPTDLADVLAGADVLVLPSLMRESHSLVTREALAAGLTVVCTDTLGPEEAVSHSVNGLVVPAGDDLGLADALRTLVEDPALVARLREVGLLASLRTLDDQVDGLVATYGELLTSSSHRAAPQTRAGGTLDASRDATTPDAGPAPLARVVIASGIGGASLRYRARLAAEGLALHGVRADVVHYRDPDLPRLAALADAVVLYRVPATIQVLELAASVRARPEPVPLVFDIDDLVFDDALRDEVPGIAHLPAEQVDLWWQGVQRYRTTMELCDVFVGTTEALCRHAEDVTGMPTHRWRNGAGQVLAQVSDLELQRPRRPGPLRLGYFSGTDTHDHDWAEVEPAVVEVLRRHPDVELWLGGHITTTPALEPLADRVRRLPFVAWHRLPALLRDVDVNLAPLVLGGRFNEAKSAIKWLEAALVGTPTVASPTQPFREAVDDGVNGLLASTVQQWTDGLDRLLRDPALRRRLGDRARRDVLLELGPHLQGRRYLDLLLAAREHVQVHGHRAPGTGHTVVALDEPAEPTPLEPYATAALPQPTALVAARVLRVLGHLLLRSADTLQQDGPREVAAGGGRVARRLARRGAGIAVRRVGRALPPEAPVGRVVRGVVRRLTPVA